MKKDNPISLFSFQDIITCLTGIMIVVVLVILLQLVESTAAMVKNVEMQPEYAALKKKQTELLLKREKLVRKSKTHQTESSIYSELSLAELKNLLKREEHFSDIQAKMLVDLEKQSGQQKSEIKETKQQIQKIQNDILAFSKEERKLLELHAILMNLQKKQSKTEGVIDRKKKMLRFEFSGLADKIPILIECSEWGFRVKKYPDGDVVTFGNPKTAIVDQIGKLVTWLKNQDFSQTYPVLLFRESSIPFQSQIVESVMDINSRIQIGRELLASGEECF